MGSGNGTRMGTEIFNRRLWGRFTLDLADSTNYVRWFILIDRDPLGANFSLAGLFESATDPITSLFNYTVKDRFIILRDRTVYLDSDRKSTQISVKIPLRCKTQYLQTSNLGTIADLQFNAIHFFLVSDSTAIVHPQVTGHFMFQYDP